MKKRERERGRGRRKGRRERVAARTGKTLGRRRGGGMIGATCRAMDDVKSSQKALQKGDRTAIG